MPVTTTQPPPATPAINGPAGGGNEPTAGGPTILPERVEELMAKVRADGLQLLGHGGLIAELSKRLLERALDEELTDHLGYERGDPAGRNGGNSRNGTTPKRLLTEAGPVDLDLPRDRDGSFEPVIVPKGHHPPGGVQRQRRRPLRRGDVDPGHPPGA